MSLGVQNQGDNINGPTGELQENLDAELDNSVVSFSKFFSPIN